MFRIVRTVFWVSVQYRLWSHHVKVSRCLTPTVSNSCSRYLRRSTVGRTIRVSWSLAGFRCGFRKQRNSTTRSNVPSELYFFALAISPRPNWSKSTGRYRWIRTLSTNLRRLFFKTIAFPIAGRSTIIGGWPPSVMSRCPDPRGGWDQLWIVNPFSLHLIKKPKGPWQLALWYVGFALMEDRVHTSDCEKYPLALRVEFLDVAWSPRVVCM